MKSPAEPRPLWNPYVAGVALGLVLFASIFITGAGLGGSGGVARVMSFFADATVPETVNRNPYLARMAGGDLNPLDNRMVWMMLGLLAGGFIAGWTGGRLRVETFKGPRISTAARLAMAFAGGGLMGWGAGMARGCTSGQALSGGAVLSAGSWAFMMMVFFGAYLLAYPLRKVWN